MLRQSPERGLLVWKVNTQFVQCDFEQGLESPEIVFWCPGQFS
jgi:hypothetical protein